jgi:hypothetical protein
VSSVKFGELPEVTEARATSTRWDQVARDLRSKPGLWACVRVCETGPAASAMAQAIKRGRIVAFRPVGSFEAVSRGRETWARFAVSCSVGTVEVTES